MSASPVSLARRFFEDLLGTGKWDLAAEFIDEGVTMHHPASPTPIVGLPAVQGVLAGFRGGFPDLAIEVLDAFGDGDRAVARWRMTGTNTEPLFGAPATGKAVAVNGISIVRVANGKIVEDWVAEDTAGLMRQLGAA